MKTRLAHLAASIGLPPPDGDEHVGPHPAHGRDEVLDVRVGRVALDAVVHFDQRDRRAQRRQRSGERRDGPHPRVGDHEHPFAAQRPDLVTDARRRPGADHDPIGPGVEDPGRHQWLPSAVPTAQELGQRIRPASAQTSRNASTQATPNSGL